MTILDLITQGVVLGSLGLGAGVLGGVIGFILVAMYLPIFKMGQVVTGS